MAGKKGLILRGGTLVTMDSRRRVLKGDVLVQGGRIAKIGRVQAGAHKTIDVSGKIVLPGLVQSHVHLCQTLFRGAADGLPLLPWLRKRIWPFEGAHDERSIALSAELGLAEMIRGGTTTILDMGTVHHQDVIFEKMAQSGIRGFSGKAMMDLGHGVPDTLRETTEQSLEESHRLCDEWHGAEEGRLHYAYAPRFILSCSERLLREVAEAAPRRRALIHSHVAEHKDERIAVKEALGRDDVAALRSFGLRGTHVVLAHGVQLRATEMKQMAADGTRIVHCPSANMKLASGIADVRAMRQAGVVVGIGADGAPCNNRMSPWLELREAALLAKVKTGDATALSAQEALELATIDGARVLGLDSEIGSIEVGKHADLCLLDLDGPENAPGGDVYSRLVYTASDHHVSEVMVGGELLVRKGKLQRYDRESLVAQAQRQLKAVAKRARVELPR